jgi:hypothetical protein
MATDRRADEGGNPRSAGWTEADENGSEAKVTKKRMKIEVTIGS